MMRSVNNALVVPLEDGRRIELTSPTAMPAATSFLWNERMMLQLNCRGYAVAQHLQPEPSKYAHAPNLEATTFMQPEQPHYAHHPGRFVYIKDEESGEIFSAPYEPVRRPGARFSFAPGLHDVRWTVEALDIEIVMQVRLPEQDAVELWDIAVTNRGETPRRLSVYPVFSIGYMSWMNLSAAYEPGLGGIVARSVTPYQKVADYERIRGLKDCTFMLHDTPPDAWEANRHAFEGEGGLHHPESLTAQTLAGGDACYETPLAALQYRIQLEPGENVNYRFLFGPAKDDAQIQVIRDKYLGQGAFSTPSSANANACLESVRTPDEHFNSFVNHWLPRQLAFHGQLDRLTTDPQTRNFLQDHLGMAYLDPQDTRQALLLALGQQLDDGNLPDGILLHENAELKYINQVPHSDHCVWLPLCLQAYLDESGDSGFLDETVETDRDTLTVAERVHRAVAWLIANRDDRGLSYINQGDWCDPMNMVGHKGKGVSGWLSLATVYACDTWADLCERHGLNQQAREMREAANEIRQAVNHHLWDGEWFARGITDDGRHFGVSSETEGKIYLNPQSWAVLAKATDASKINLLSQAVARELETEHGTMMLAPAYTRMHEDIGRLTQKSPGVSENGSIYNHAGAFWIYALYHHDEADHAWRLIQRMIPGPSERDYRQRGQLPVFLPNYYRGAVEQFPRTAGRSSQLVNTGTVAWIYRSLVEGLFGLKGCNEGLRITPCLPSHWDHVTLRRRFRGAVFDVEIRRKVQPGSATILLDGQTLGEPLVRNPVPGRTYQLAITLPSQAK